MLSDRLQLGRGAGQGLEAEGADLQQLELLCWMGKTSLEGAQPCGSLGLKRVLGTNTSLLLDF